MSHGVGAYFTSPRFLGKLYLIMWLLPLAFPGLIPALMRLYERLYIAWAVRKIRRDRRCV